jgi:ferritin
LSYQFIHSVTPFAKIFAQKFFKKQSDEEREHAEKLIEYQNNRGGRVVYKDIKVGPEWKSPLQALETALQMELVCALAVAGKCTDICVEAHAYVCSLFVVWPTNRIHFS